MLGPALALGSSASGGVSDFIGGTTSRRMGTIQFTLCTQLLSLVLAGGWVAISGEPAPAGRTLAAAVGAGFGVMISLSAFFQAMVVGTISIVAPISATGVALPIFVGVVHGERPGPAQVVGIFAAIGGILLSARSRWRMSSIEPGVGFAGIAAVGSGLFFWLMAPASRHGIPWAMLVSRAIPVMILIMLLTIHHPSRTLTLTRRNLTGIFFAALLGSCGMALYGFATHHGQLAIMSVLASLYPAINVILAHVVLKERIRLVQRLGVCAVLAGVVLLST